MHQEYSQLLHRISGPWSSHRRGHYSSVCTGREETTLDVSQNWPVENTRLDVIRMHKASITSISSRSTIFWLSGRTSPYPRISLEDIPSFPVDPDTSNLGWSKLLDSIPYIVIIP